MKKPFMVYLILLLVIKKPVNIESSKFILMKNNSNIGTEWRIWDLHVHSPASFGGNDYLTFIENLNSSVAEVIGINDYHTIEGYERVIESGKCIKTIFPVVEFRMHTLLQTRKNPNGVQINFHIIFNNDIKLLDTIRTWLSSLKCFNEKGEKTQLGNAQDLTKISFDFDVIVDSLKEFNLYNNHALVWLPYTEYGGIDDIDPDTDGYFKLSLINKAHFIGSSSQKAIDFFQWKNKKFTDSQYRGWFDNPKPCIKGSDAHKINYPFGKLQNHLSEPIDRYCWLNSSKTFDGLKHVIIEPNRVFIGEEPDLLKRVKINSTKFIKSITVDKIEGEFVEDIWFQNFKIEFNNSLVAIIGHKGGGKSALTDILGLCGNAHHNPENFSFLNRDKFRKPRPYNLSERFKATIEWRNGGTFDKKLNENPDLSLAERVKYIPQNFLETVCTDVESEIFEKEMKKIIFSHTPYESRLGKNSLDELIALKSGLLSEDIEELKKRISDLNFDIIDLERKRNDNYRKSIEDLIELKKAEVKAFTALKPKNPEVLKDTQENKNLVGEISTLRDEIKALEENISTNRNSKSKLLIKKDELTRSLEFYQKIEERLIEIGSQEDNYAKILVKYDIDIKNVIHFKIDTSMISSLIKSVSGEIDIIDKHLNEEDPKSYIGRLATLKKKLDEGQEKLSQPEKEKQKFLSAFKIWQEQLNQLNGDEEKEGTLQYLEKELSYIQQRLKADLESKYDERRILSGRLFGVKSKLVEVRKELFQPVTEFIDEFKDLRNRYDVKIDVVLELQSFKDKFFSYINQNRTGTFYGIEDGDKTLTGILNKADFNAIDGYIDFLNELINCLQFDKRNSEVLPMNVESQLLKGTEIGDFYDFIFGADYLQPVYELKLGDKSLKELSPGERGALLLIFYLVLDKSDIPLLIDQPEENLDNESVYNILVHFIKKIKEQRQIIIVTHNPNLAVVCDADQIINMRIEKDNLNKVMYSSGAIEDEVINKAIVNILEGTLPAFSNRESKYRRV